MRRFLGKLYVQVLIGVFAGVALGVFMPHLGSDLKPLGDVFIRLIKMVFAPVIFAARPRPMIVVFGPTLMRIRSVWLRAERTRASSSGPLGATRPHVAGS